MPEKLELSLVRYPDPVLRKVAADVEAFDDELRATVEAMFDLMYASNGVGLAAPQVGLRKRILVLDPAGDPSAKDSRPLVLVNPRILERTGTPTVYEEGCLSFPGIFAEVKRPELCKVSALDAEGEAVEATFDGFTSRIIQHEQDHLDGVLLVDRMSPADKQRHKLALQDLIDEYKASQVT